MKTAIKSSVILYALFSIMLASAAQLEVIPLQHRSADEVIAIIKPLLARGGSVTGMNDQLIIKTTAANLAEIKQLLQHIDKAARRLMITVRQDVDGTSLDADHSLSGSYSSGDVTIANTTRQHGQTGARISVEDDRGNTVRYRTRSTRSKLEDNSDFRLQTIEGQPAFIESGQSIPVANHDVYVTHGAVVEHDTIEYRDVTSGFYILPRLNGDQVTLLVSPQLSRIHPHQRAIFDIQNVETTVHGALGEWIRIGGVDKESYNNKTQTLQRTRRREQEQRTVLIKVEEVY
ncbi:MAG: secretin N-terminal domain-containing protein [Gammaproteobacteria bacterium]